MAALGIFFRVVIIDQNLIERELHMLTKTHTHVQFDNFLILKFLHDDFIISVAIISLSKI